MGRPSKYTPDAQEKACEAVRKGATYELAAHYAGISYELLRQWMREKVAFLAAIKEAEGVAAVRWLAQIEKAAATDWRAAAWKLERRYPRQYGRTVHDQEHRGNIEIRIARVEHVNDWRQDGGRRPQAIVEAGKRMDGDVDALNDEA